ncbi:MULTISPECIES: hypothetical protein [Lichenihabitans]|uniref:hypothetical protein n=1 Tax=Lichenihabitans TaxID=2723776 RepID=UPI0014792CF5|nr:MULTISPECIES: hypothetical protein [Lichenihabitans]UDL95694.1 hypothetical protein LGH83_05635 [Lichenihabitans sp. PAMC28606]
MITNASCNKCAFFDDHAVSGAQAPKNDGLCRFNPPISQPGPEEHGLWPVVSTNDWCGHFNSASAQSQVAAE